MEQNFHRSLVQQPINFSALLRAPQVTVKVTGGGRSMRAIAAHLRYISTNLQELLGHSDVQTTMIYTHVLNRGGHAVRSPLDQFLGETVAK